MKLKKRINANVNFEKGIINNNNKIILQKNNK